MIFSRRVRTVGFLLAFCLSVANALRCLRCSSEINPFCRYGFAPSVQCNDESTVCITYVGRISYRDSNTVIRDCAVVDYGNFCQQFEPQSPDAASVSDHHHQQQQQQQKSKLEICVKTCRWSSCNKLPAVE